MTRTLLLLAALTATLQAAGPGIVFEGGKGPGKGKHIVLIAGDHEYRSEEALPQLARILATRHGFKCTVLFAVDPKDGTIDPGKPNIPGLEALAKADLLVLFLRWLDLPDDQMKPLTEYIESEKPAEPPAAAKPGAKPAAKAPAATPEQEPSVAEPDDQPG